MKQTISVVLCAVFLSTFPRTCYADQARMILEEGTPKRLKLLDAISSKISSAGGKVHLSVVEEITSVDGKTVVIKGSAPATAFLTNVDEKDGGKGGKLSLEITSVKAVDGTKVSVRGIKSKSGHGGAGVGCYLAGGVLLGVVGL